MITEQVHKLVSLTGQKDIISQRVDRIKIMLKGKRDKYGDLGATVICNSILEQTKDLEFDEKRYKDKLMKANQNYKVENPVKLMNESQENLAALKDFYPKIEKFNEKVKEMNLK